MALSVFCSFLLGLSGSCWSSRSVQLNPEEFVPSLPPFVLWLLSVALGGFVAPGVNQLPDKQLLDQSCPGIFGVAAVGGEAVALNHSAALERVDLRRHTSKLTTSANTRRILQHL